MAKRTPTRKQQKSWLRQIRDRGLAGRTKIDLRKKPGRKERNLISKFGDILRRKASVINVGTHARARKYKGLIKVGSRVVVPRGKGERVRFDKSSGEIVSVRKVGRKKIKKIIAPQHPREIKAPRGMRKMFVVPFMHGDRAIRYQRFEKWDDLLAFMSGYEDKFHNWRGHVSVEFVRKQDKRREVIKRI